MPCADGLAFAISCSASSPSAIVVDDLADRRAAVQHVRSIVAIDDDHRAVGMFDDGAAER